MLLTWQKDKRLQKTEKIYSRFVLVEKNAGKTGIIRRGEEDEVVRNFMMKSDTFK